MSWQTFSLHFKQTYDAAYRYLDRCGEFMHAAVKEMDFITAEPKPAGAVLEIPERGVKATVDTAELTVTQEWPGKEDAFFLSICAKLTTLVSTHFDPTRVVRNGFASRSVWPIADSKTLLTASLKFGGDAHIELGKLLGMVPAHKQVDCNFMSGSMDLHVLLHPVTFEKVALSRHTANFKATEKQKQRAERMSIAAERSSTPITHALMLDLDLIEDNPPQNALDAHYSALKRHMDALRTEFIVT